MCSGGSCDMAGLIGGPVGNLVGMGIKALVNGAPIGPRTSEALTRPTEQEGIKQFYDNVETHLKGMLQVLEPALEIKKILCGESKSADRQRSANSPRAVIQYYSPQNVQKSQAGCSGSKKSPSCLSMEKSSSKSANSYSCKIEKSTGKKSSCSVKNKSTEKPSQLDPPSHSKSSSKNEATGKSRSTSLNSQATGFKSCCSAKHDEQSSKSSSAKVSKSKKKNSRSKICCICDVNLEENIVLAALPCQHLFCYTCLAAGSGKRCRLCDKAYDMKNVSQIFH